MSATEWSELAVRGLPTGTVTLLLADVEGSTRLWETQPEAMTAAIARLDATLTDLVAVHGGVRPVEQGEGDSFVLAFARASDAVACALALQRAPLAPIRLRIGVNTGEIQLRDEGNYIGPTINRTARLRDLGHGGQTVLSGTTHDLVVDRLPDDAWLMDLGTHPLRDLPRPERVVQLCHPDIPNEFPPPSRKSPAMVERFNEVVDHFELNEVARDLPNFGDLKSVNILSLGRQQGHAVDRWRTATADHLRPLWSAYQKLAAFHGHLLGPLDDSDRSTNLTTSCVLGDPGSFGAADAAATRLAAISFGGDSVKAYAPIAPFVVPAMVGYQLHLSTLDDAAAIRRRVQGV